MTISFATVTGLFGYSDFLVPSRKLLRPPGVIQEEQFLRDCIKCNACADACPVRGIGIAHLSDGLLNIGTPTLSGYCMVYRGLEKPTPQSVKAWKKSKLSRDGKEACLECVKVCPSGALRPINVDEVRMGTAVVNRNICRVYVFGNCSFPCVDACPFDAITVMVGPVVDAKKCVGCNICAFACLTREYGPTSIAMRPTET